MMSPERAGALLLCFLGGTFAAGAPASDAAWLALSAVPWALSLACVPELPWRPALAAWAAWLGWAGVCALVSPEPWLSLTAWWRGAAMLFTLALASSWWARRERRVFALAMAGVGLLGGAALLASSLGWPFPKALAVPAGAWAAAGAACAAGWLSGDDDGWTAGAWTALAVAALALALIGPWPARLALAAGGLCCVLAAPRRGAGLALLAAAGAGLAWDLSGWRAWEPSSGWGAAVSVLRANSVVGVGPGLLGRELARSGWPGSAQSFALGVGAETGYFGLLLFAAAAAASVPAGFARLDGAGRAASAAFVAFAAYGLLADVPASPAFLAALAASAAVGLSAGRLGEARASDFGTPLRLQRWFTGIGLALVLAAAAPRWLLRRALAQAEAATTPAMRIAALERASRLAPDDGAIHARVAQEDLLVVPARVGDALRRVLLAAEAEPGNPVYRARLAELWAAFGALDRAAETARETLSLEPAFLSPRLILAELEAVEGRVDAARTLLAEARAMRAQAPGAGAVAAWDEDRERRIEERLLPREGRRRP